jgi:hypothetical protein
VRVMSAFERKVFRIHLPECPNCQIRMLLARTVQISQNSEKRTFDCPKCKFVHAEIVDDPLRSVAVPQLTNTGTARVK